MTLRWRIIGCGDVAEKKGGPALYGVPGSELIAVMRRDVAKAEDFARRHSARRWYSRAEELLADPDVTARTYPIVQRMRCLLAEGAIGQPMLARINLTGYYNPPDLGAPQQWHADPAIAGRGVMFDVGSHRLDVLVYLLGDMQSVAGYVDTLHASYAVDDAVAVCASARSAWRGVSTRPGHGAAARARRRPSRCVAQKRAPPTPRR